MNSAILSFPRIRSRMKPLHMPDSIDSLPTMKEVQPPDKGMVVEIPKAGRLHYRCERGIARPLFPSWLSSGLTEGSDTPVRPSTLNPRHSAGYFGAYSGLSGNPGCRRRLGWQRRTLLGSNYWDGKPVEPAPPHLVVARPLGALSAARRSAAHLAPLAIRQ